VGSGVGSGVDEDGAYSLSCGGEGIMATMGETALGENSEEEIGLPKSVPPGLFGVPLDFWTVNFLGIV